MNGNEQGGWEPDPRKMGNWRSMFETPGNGAQGDSGASGEARPPHPSAAFDDQEIAPDPLQYRPWILQRGGSRPNMMLDFRRFEPRSGMWSGWAISYPYLMGMEYTGDGMVSLDFGKSQVIIMGRDLTDLVRHTQQGSVLAVHEFAASVWPKRPNGPIVESIRQVGGDSVK